MTRRGAMVTEATKASRVCIHCIYYNTYYLQKIENIDVGRHVPSIIVYHLIDMVCYQSRICLAPNVIKTLKLCFF